jgi:hypothetical protein
MDSIEKQNFERLELTLIEKICAKDYSTTHSKTRAGAENGMNDSIAIAVNQARGVLLGLSTQNAAADLYGTRYERFHIGNIGREYVPGVL